MVFLPYGCKATLILYSQFSLSRCDRSVFPVSCIPLLSSSGGSDIDKSFALPHTLHFTTDDSNRKPTMPKFNTTVDNVSPLITYSPPEDWYEGTRADPDFSRYSNGGTFTLTTSFNASATFTFNGTGIWIYGAKRINHGPYSVVLDNGPPVQGNGFSSSAVFQTPLFSAMGLQSGSHIVTLSNAVTDSNAPFLDVDFIVWETDIGTGNQTISQQSFEDNQPLFNYQPNPSAWQTNPPSVQHFSGQNGHVTANASASVNCTFQVGDAIAIYGAVGPTNGFYDIVLDNGHKVTFNATKQNVSTEQLLYFASGVGGGIHSVRMSPSFENQTLAIDYAVIYTSLSTPLPSSNTNSGGDTITSKTTHKSSTVLIASVVSVIGVLVILIIAILFLLRRRRRRSQPEKQHFDSAANEDSPTPSLNAHGDNHHVNPSTMSDLFHPLQFSKAMAKAKMTNRDRRGSSASFSIAPSSSVVLTSLVSGPQLNNSDASRASRTSQPYRPLPARPQS
ncbi:hypothetical protein BD410DRAFT_109294 [Rickenella mellea]|uniref:Transmembrane protein n=1 Tax=Rickenella mellea TaxID=50990 RepID=A0A4Y7Q8Z6_9AGAM|nr:hypothetical protein BD410DRAFT_109294 [Rickenella mellea]